MRKKISKINKEKERERDKKKVEDPKNFDHEMKRCRKGEE